MKDDTDLFRVVTERLKLALGLGTDAELAAKLGLGATAWAQRKKRSSLPTKVIDEVIAAEELNPEFIYSGIGKVHVPADGQAWRKAFLNKMSTLFGVQTYLKVLTSHGYRTTDLKAVSAGKKEASAELLRDLHDYLRVDLHALLCDKPAVTDEEQALLDAYRRATGPGRKAVTEMVGLLAQPGRAAKDAQL